MSRIRFENQTTPATPPTGKTIVYVDSADSHTKQIDDTGTVIDLTGGAAVSGPGSSVDKGIAVWDGTGGLTLADSGMRHYGSSATDPTVPAPADGDIYYNSTLQLQMIYDSTRGKWLSVECVMFWFGRNGNTGTGAFFRGPGNRAYSATTGFPAWWDGTVVAIGYTRTDTDAATFEITAGGVTVASLASSSVIGGSSAIDGDFSQFDILGARNASGGNTVSNVHGWVRIRWRA